MVRRPMFQASRLWSLAMALLVAASGSLAVGAEPKGPAPRYGEFNPAHNTVEMFEAIEAGKLDVKLVVKDSTQARVMIANKTNEPLNVRLPEAFSGVHTLAQFGGGGGAGMGAGGGAQAVGGGMGGGGGLGGGAGGGGGGFFNVPSDKVAELSAECVCLEHGKPEPTPVMEYRIQPIAAFTDKLEVQELCKMLGKGLVDQRAAQAAVWHLQNEMSWQELASKRIKRLVGPDQPYFTQQQMQFALNLAEHVKGEAEKARKAAAEAADEATAEEATDEVAATSSN